ncbi:MULTISPECIES: MFS transporter family glucose-6-phosphate receptor UhpC [Tenebrionibacter/Tenebrionicola group]|jgi:OPA family sugar phosphate sensor protein UhpC-like MFS transporter|uniref:MFS transporter family glucose-6-phosphate receptor UhpC n=2 Tax=Tenebrionibacter/Tenebrionicola group TaxID=2969848 RepID=A0A8K0V8M0_9ENTR|nr:MULTISPECIES: MFS transporter family glucose-6-phosphate receptor UhpC [Tenebrionibacter/Tenebrionicola group]MBK4716924.1 MFS transporter family glucose-6-phosphate receptor UhpC [Tenebrionibacter intestinalis]MBV4411396.1 MFS transporter family glucose-6-phosphate receptor UhpC [Tenebrionicola larvae]MBV5095838.1 MFS transporter family glucose-6-phosphate receptor UhpC [Tenebrionicola larvae]
MPQPLSPQEINQRYRYWRARLLITMAAGYAAFYLTRKSLNVALPDMQQALALDKADIGLLGTLFYTAYGLSKFGCGLWYDRYGPREFMGAGLVATGILNLVFALGDNLPLLLTTWALNGFFQGWGWPPCARLLTQWYSRNERGLWWGCWNMSINIGGALLPLLCVLLASLWGWRAALMAPGIIAIASGMWLCTRLCGTPQQEGLPCIGEWRQDALELRQQRQSPPQPLWPMLRDSVLANRAIWLLGLMYVLVYLIRIALNDWGNIWMAEGRGASLLGANAAVILFEAGGLLGALFAGWGSDLLFRGQRAPMILLFALGMFITVCALWLMPVHHYALLAAIFFSCGFFVFGPQMLTGLAAVEYCHKDAAGSVTGFLGLFAYLGAALAGWPLALVIERYGWPGMFITLTAAATLIAVLLMPLLLAAEETPDTPNRRVFYPDPQQ